MKMYTCHSGPLFVVFCLFIVRTVGVELTFTPPIESGEEFEARIVEFYEDADSMLRDNIEQYIRELYAGKSEYFSDLIDENSLDYINGSITYLREDIENSLLCFQELCERTGFSNPRYVLGYAKALSKSGHPRFALNVIKNGIEKSLDPVNNLYDYLLQIEGLEFSARRVEKAQILAKFVTIRPDNNHAVWYELARHLIRLYNDGMPRDIDVEHDSDMINYKKFLSLLSLGLQLYPRSFSIIQATAILHLLAAPNDEFDSMCACHLLQRYLDFARLDPVVRDISEALSLLDEVVVSIESRIGRKVLESDYQNLQGCHDLISTNYITVKSAGKDALSINDAEFGIEEHGLWIHMGCVDEAVCPRQGWTIVDIVSTSTVVHRQLTSSNLSELISGSVEKFYSSHTLEHLSPVFGRDTHEKGYSELCQTLAEINRVLKIDGNLYVSVPDIDILISIYVQENMTLAQKNSVLTIMFGGQDTQYNFHKMGWHFENLAITLEEFGFCSIERVKSLDIFPLDASNAMVMLEGKEFGLGNIHSPLPFSINVRAKKCLDIDKRQERKHDPVLKFRCLYPGS